jgi:hypothetical protein
MVVPFKKAMFGFIKNKYSVFRINRVANRKLKYKFGIFLKKTDY